MATDITSAEVHALMNSSETAIDLAAFIAHADLVVSEDLALAELTDARLRMITLYMAAHFATLALFNGGLTSVTVGESTERYAGAAHLDQGFKSTLWGQQAIAFDTSGTLALNASPRIKAELRVV